MKFRVVWDVAPCCHIEVDRRFRVRTASIIRTMVWNSLAFRVTVSQCKNISRIITETSVALYIESARDGFVRATMAMPWHRSLVAGLSPRRPVFAPGTIHVGFVVDKVALGQVPPPPPEFFGFPLSIYHSTVTLQTYIIWGMRDMLA
jgi:hypothetical protein